MVSVEYQVLPPICEFCKVFGHTSHQCSKSSVAKPKPVVTEVWQQVGKGKNKAVPFSNIVEASSVNQEGELTELSLVGGPSAITSIGSSEASVNDIIITNVEKAGSILCTLPVKNHDPVDPSLLQLAIIQPNSMVEAASDVVNERDHSDDSPFTPVLSKKAAKKAAKVAKTRTSHAPKGSPSPFTFQLINSFILSAISFVYFY